MAIYRGLKQFYVDLINCGSYFQHILLLLMRIYWGYAFFKAGLGKIEDMAGIESYLSSLNVPFPTITAHLVAWIECIGGLCLLFGFASRFVVIPLAIVMLSALFTAHSAAIHKIFEDPDNFVRQTPFTFLLTSLIVFAFGPGNISVDYLLQKYVFRTRNE
jgi:putative oxidoreductase